MLNKLNIIIDNREQTPWSFPEHAAAVQWGTLSAGDYALAGDSQFAIERKSLDDFLGTISSGWKRFLNELDRMAKAGFCARIIIVEGDFKRCCFVEDADGKITPPLHNHFLLTPQFICSRIAELAISGVQVLFAGSPDYAAALAISIFRHRHMRLLNGTDANTCKG